MNRLCLFVTFIILASCGNNHLLKEVKKINHYPSASGIEYFNKQFYVIGDDARDLLILDSNFVIKDSVHLYDAASSKISKSTKADLESITVLPNNKLLLLGSGSLSPYRTTGWIIDPVTKQKDSIRLDSFFLRLQHSGIKEINIEGATAISGCIVLANRGSKGYRKNQLIFTHEQFWNRQATCFIYPVLFGSNTDTTVFNGISGLAYSAKTDNLICTVSTEDTRNNVDDGAIGKSYLWIVNSISTKREWKAINPNKIIDLENIDQRFKGQKIESVCITKETKNFFHLVLAADNDNGSSTLFKLIIAKK